MECLDYDGFVCMASSASGHVFECTYKKDGHWVDAGTPNRKPQHPGSERGRYEGICEDYKDLEEE